MRDKIIKIILTALPIILAISLAGSTIRSCSIRRSDSKRTAELERRALKYEELYTEANQLYSEALGTIEGSELELGNLRAAHRRAGELAKELEKENQRLAATINELGDLRSELTEGAVRAEELIRAIEEEARRALGIVERLQARSEDPD